MSVFRNYNPKAAGDVVKNAFPMVTPIPWTPTSRNVRANPQIPSQPQRIQPTERGSFFPGSSNGGGTLAPAMSSGCGSCGGCSGCGQSLASPDSGPTPSDIATGPSFPTTQPIVTAPPRRTQIRATGTLRRPSPIGTLSRSGVRARISSFGGR